MTDYSVELTSCKTNRFRCRHLVSLWGGWNVVV